MFSSGIPVGPGASEMVLEELTTDGGLAVVGGWVGATSLLGGLVVGHIHWLSIKHDVVIRFELASADCVLTAEVLLERRMEQLQVASLHRAPALLASSP
jgi:hypothetical protein